MSVEVYWRRSHDERAWHEARWVERKQQCGRCGRPRSECSDPDRAWYPQREVCYATREREAASAAYSELHKERPWTDGAYEHWAKDRSASHPFRFDMGMTIGVADTDIRPLDKFTTREHAPLLPPLEGDGDTEDAG